MCQEAAEGRNDIYHLERMGDDVCRDVVEYLPQIGHLHVAAVPTRTAPDPATDRTYARVIPAAQAAGYRGYWGLEFVRKDDPLEEIAWTIAYFPSCAGD